MTNFLDCVRTRKRPNADVEIGYRSTLLCRLGNIAYRQRSTLTWDSSRATLADKTAADGLLAREYRRGFELPVV